MERESTEETGLIVSVDKIVDSWVHPVLADRQVLIVTYRCHDLGDIPPITISHEHRA